MKNRPLSSIRKFWAGLQGAVHPDDQKIFNLYRDHSFNLDFPPPAFIGDVDTAPVVVLMSNGGYKPGETEKEFPDRASFYEHRDYLRGERAALPRHLSRYYLDSPLGPWIENGLAVLVNAVPYRSPQLSKERNNKLVAKHLASLAVHRRWLFEEVLPEAKAGRRFVLVHRNGWWKVPRDEYEGPHVLFSDRTKAEPNRRTPDQNKLGEAQRFLEKQSPAPAPYPGSERFGDWSASNVIWLEPGQVLVNDDPEGDPYKFARHGEPDLKPRKTQT